MKKRRNYIFVLTVLAVVFLTAVVFNIRSIREFYLAVFVHMTTAEVLISASIVGFVFVGNKNYWLIVMGAALVLSIIIQLFIVGNGFVLHLIIARFCAFVCIVYIMNFVKIIVNK